MGAKLSQIRGILLEEVILYLLRRAGYTTVEDCGNDPTLSNGPAGLVVQGRGGKHQIDAIADWCLHPPFSFPQRLLVEAKCYSDSNPIGLNVTRSAVGVLKDLSEHWVTSGPHGTASRRYHYLSAIFSASGFTADAEEYAYAQEIYLLPLQDASYFKPIIEAIRNVQPASGAARGNPKVEVSLSTLRQNVRMAIRHGINSHNVNLAREKLIGIDDVVSTARSLEWVLLGMLAGQFPVLLVPSPEMRATMSGGNLRSRYRVRIRYDSRCWYLQSTDHHNRQLFSFDLPPVLFQQYASGDRLTRNEALHLKGEIMSSFQAVWRKGSRLKVVQFQIDQEWFDALSQQTQEKAATRTREASQD